MVKTIFAGSFSLPFRRPSASASRTAFSISRCEVMPTFFRNLRRLVLNTSSFINASQDSLLCKTHFIQDSLTQDSLMLRVVQHVFAEVALAAIGFRFGPLSLDVAILAAGDIFR